MRLEEQVLVNLRVLSQLQAGDRLNAEGNLFYIERGFLSGLWRWWRQETRERTLSRIDDIMSAARGMGEAKALLGPACKGLESLRDTTYVGDATTTARLDNIIAAWTAISSPPCASFASSADRAAQSARSPASPASSPPSSPVASRSCQTESEQVAQDASQELVL